MWRLAVFILGIILLGLIVFEAYKLHITEYGWFYDLTYNPMATVFVATLVNTGVVLLVDYLRGKREK